MSTLILLRHGESTWNREGLFTGWTDVPLSEQGFAEAAAGGAALLEAGIVPDLVFTSVLLRSIQTANVALEACDRHWIPVTRAWELNERHYGALQGLNKKDTSAKYGLEQTHIWRRSYDVPPPALELDDPRHPRFDVRYRDVDPASLPATECLADVVARTMPYWRTAIEPVVRSGQTVLISGHGNSLRAMLMEFDGISRDDIAEVNIPTGVPRVYTFDDEMRVTSAAYLGDPDVIAAATEAVAHQAG